MGIFEVYKEGEIGKKAEKLFREERSLQRLDGWFLARETAYLNEEELGRLPAEMAAAVKLDKVIDVMPLSISEHAVFAGTIRKGQCGI